MDFLGTMLTRRAVLLTSVSGGQRHAGCAETFYKEGLLKELQSKTAEPEERQRMLEMLKQLEAEEESATGDVEADTEDVEADAAADLQARFADVNLGMPAVEA